MFSSPDFARAAAVMMVATIASCLCGAAMAAPVGAAAYAGIGRAATPEEIAAWDIDVRPDFKGLPKGAGSVAKGREVWESKCASCHGVFGESNEFFAPIVGGTTPADISSGRVARLTDSAYPGRTTLMKLSSLSALWDYINRAMPWTAPKSLGTEEVYGVTAYILNLAGIVHDDHVLSDLNIAQAQMRLPNRDGTTTAHGLWPGRGMGNGGRPDVKAVACMSRCAVEPKVASYLPDFARDAHGNLAEQNRLVGAQRGADTRRAAATAAAAGLAEGAAAPSALALALVHKHACTACHGVSQKIVGPGFGEIAARYTGRADATEYLAGKVKGGGAGAWGTIAMPAQALPEEDARAIAAWLAAGAGR